MWNLRQEAVACMGNPPRNGEKLVLSGHPGGVPDVTFSPGGDLLATVGKDHKIKIWDPIKGILIQDLLFPGEVQTVAFTFDGRFLAAGGDQGAIRIWEVDSWKELDALNGLGQNVWSVTFNPNGGYFAAGTETGGVTVWRMVPTVSNHEKKAGLSFQQLVHLSDRFSLGLCFSPDSKLLAWVELSAWEKTSGHILHLWDPE